MMNTLISTATIINQYKKEETKHFIENCCGGSLKDRDDFITELKSHILYHLIVLEYNGDIDGVEKEIQRLATIRDDQLSKVVDGQTSAMKAVQDTAATRLRQRLDSAESAVPVDVKSAVRQQEVGDVVERILSTADTAMGDVGSSKPVLRHRTSAMTPGQSRKRVFDVSDTGYRQRIRREVADYVQDTARRNGWIAVFDRSSARADKTQFMKAALIRERRFIW